MTQPEPRRREAGPPRQPVKPHHPREGKRGAYAPPDSKEKRGGYSGGKPAKQVKPPAKAPSATLTAPKQQKGLETDKK